MQHQSTKLSGLVTQLLDISRIEGGKMALNLENTDVVRLAQDVARDAQASTNRHIVRVDAPESLEAVVDAMRLEQVLVNLVGNAIKFSPAGGDIEIEIDAASTGRVRIAVTDHGVGIPLAHRAGIFERFYQAHTSEFYGGMGLGLYISRQIVELHGGRMDVEFPTAGGTRFIVEVPSRNTATVSAEEAA
jgi:two-component system sensor histidine kinase VicK